MRRQTINSTALGVHHLMATYARVVPITNVDGPVGRDRKIGRTEPGIRSTHRVLDLGRITSSVRRDEIRINQALAGLGVNQLTAVFLREQFPFVDYEATRCAGTRSSDVGNN